MQIVHYLSETTGLAHSTWRCKLLLVFCQTASKGQVLTYKHKDNVCKHQPVVQCPVLVRGNNVTILPVEVG